MIKQNKYKITELLDETGKQSKQALVNWLDNNGFQYIISGRGMKTVIDILEVPFRLTLSFKPTHPSIIEAYYSFAINDERWHTMSDIDVGRELIKGNQKDTTKQIIIYQTRRELQNAGVLGPRNKDLTAEQRIKLSIDIDFSKRGIYGFRDTNDNSLLYIGKTSRNFKERLAHYNNSCHNKELEMAIKDGYAEFFILLPIDSDNEEEYLAWETHFIKQLRPKFNIKKTMIDK